MSDIDPPESPRNAKTTDLFWDGEVELADSRPQLIHDVLPEIGTGLLAGQWGTYKTFVAFDLAHQIMAGGQWLGHQVVRRGGVMLVALEGQNEVAIRIRGVINDRKVVATPAPFAWLKQCPPLINGEAVPYLIEYAQQAQQRLVDLHDLPLSAILVDTMVAASGFNRDRKSTRLNSSHLKLSRMPSSA